MILLIVIYALVNVCAEILMISASVTSGSYFHYARYTNPFEVYEDFLVNWFGAFILALLYTVVLPLLAIQYWIYWIFTVGR